MDMKVMKHPLVGNEIDQLLGSTLDRDEKVVALASSVTAIALSDIGINNRRLKKGQSEIEAVFAAGIVLGATLALKARGELNE